MLRKQTSSSHRSFWLCLEEILCILHFTSAKLYGFTKVVGSFFYCPQTHYRNPNKLKRTEYCSPCWTYRFYALLIPMMLYRYWNVWIWHIWWLISWHTNKNVALRDQPISHNIICKSKKPGRLVGMKYLLLHRISPRLMNINEFRTDQDYSSVSVQIPGLIW